MQYASLVLVLSLSAAGAQQQPGGGQQPRLTLRPGGTFYGLVTGTDGDSVKMQGIQAEFRGVVSSFTDRSSTTYYGKSITLITTNQVATGVQIVATPEGYTVTDAFGKSIIIREIDQPIRTFGFTPDLASGRTGKHLGPADSYRPQDVKVGDRIAIHYDRIDGRDVCDRISIVRRPGGTVPPSPNDPGDPQGIKYHERQNAWNDWLDKGTPIPDRFLSPRELEERRAKIAPMPREAIPKIPDAEP